MTLSRTKFARFFLLCPDNPASPRTETKLQRTVTVPRKKKKRSFSDRPCGPTWTGRCARGTASTPGPSKLRRPPSCRDRPGPASLGSGTVRVCAVWTRKWENIEKAKIDRTSAVGARPKSKEGQPFFRCFLRSQPSREASGAAPFHRLPTALSPLGWLRTHQKSWAS